MRLGHSAKTERAQSTTSEEFTHLHAMLGMRGVFTRFRSAIGHRCQRHSTLGTRKKHTAACFAAFRSSDAGFCNESRDVNTAERPPLAERQRRSCFWHVYSDFEIIGNGRECLCGNEQARIDREIDFSNESEFLVSIHTHFSLRSSLLPLKPKN